MQQGTEGMTGCRETVVKCPVSRQPERTAVKRLEIAGFNTPHLLPKLWALLYNERAQLSKKLFPALAVPAPEPECRKAAKTLKSCLFAVKNTVNHKSEKIPTVIGFRDGRDFLVFFYSPSKRAVKYMFVRLLLGRRTTVVKQGISRQLCVCLFCK